MLLKAYSSKKIQDYSVNEMFSSIRVLAEMWKKIFYSKDLMIYFELLITRCAFILTYAFGSDVHDVIRFRKKIADYQDEEAFIEEQKKTKEKTLFETTADHKKVQNPLKDTALYMVSSVYPLNYSAIFPLFHILFPTFFLYFM